MTKTKYSRKIEEDLLLLRDYIDEYGKDLYYNSKHNVEQSNAFISYFIILLIILFALIVFGYSSYLSIGGSIFTLTVLLSIAIHKRYIAKVKEHTRTELSKILSQHKDAYHSFFTPENTDGRARFVRIIERTKQWNDRRKHWNNMESKL